MKSKSIVCFTASYPYGQRETYFERELEYLSNAFDDVYIVPIYNPYSKVIKRKVPKNVTVLAPVLQQGFRRLLQGVISFQTFGPLLSDFARNKVFISFSRLKKWVNALLFYNIGISYARKVLGNILTDSVLYSYWAEIPFFTSKLFIPYKKVVRMHGGDFYLDRNNGYLPLRDVIYSSGNLLLPISEDIRAMLISTYGIPENRIVLSYLGTQNKAASCSSKVDQKLRIVSCSNVYPLKRVDLIWKILREISSNLHIEWHHVGDGESMEMLKSTISNDRRGNISVIFHGQMNQDEIMNLYRDTYFDWFINTSKHEGLPVSIMEAFSFGIPAIATDVGATKEIVNECNGLLIERDFQAKDVAKMLQSCDRDSYLHKRIAAYDTWVSRFNADLNYTELMSYLQNIK